MKLAALALALLAAACRSELPPPPKIIVTLVNDSDATVCDVHLRRSEHHAAGWGTDWLDRSEAIAPSIDRSFQLPPGATWDVMIRDCNGREVATAHGVHWAADQRLRISEIHPAGT